MRVTRSLGAVAAAALVAACGGDPSAEDVLRDTADKVSEIRSADVDLELTLAPREGADEGRLGFRLDGPVDLRESGDLPAAKLRYTQIAGPEEGGATFVSTGDAAYVEVDGTAYELPDDQAAGLRAGAEGVAEGVELPVGRWFEDPELSEGERIGDQATDVVRSDLDAVAALRDVFAAVERTGAVVPDLTGAGADELREAVDEATVELVTGREDRLLRRLEVRIGFEVDVPPALEGELGDLAGGTFAFELALDDVNEPVEVEAPADPQPASALGG